MRPGYRCLGCPPGFKGNAPSGVGLSSVQGVKQQCEDINECASSESNLCDPNSECINTLVSILMIFTPDFSNVQESRSPNFSDLSEPKIYEISYSILYSVFFSLF